MGTRMRSTIPKVLQLLAGKPLLAHLLTAVRELNPARIHIVVGPEGGLVKEALDDPDLNWVPQLERRGTGHAVQQAIPFVDEQSRLLILLGDAPLISKDTMESLVSIEAPLAVLTVTVDDPAGYGRIIRGEADLIKAIVEHRDASAEPTADYRGEYRRYGR